MTKNKVIAILLCLCLCLGMTACGRDEKAEETVSKTENAASVSNGTLQEDSTALAVGKTVVSYQEYKIYYYFMKTQYESVLTQRVWSYSGIQDGKKSIGQEAIEDVLRLIIQVKVIVRAAEKQGVTLAADEKEAADYQAKKYYEGLSDSVKKENSMSIAMLSKILEENKLAEKMYHIVVGKTNTGVTAEQLKAAKVQLIYLKADDSTRAQVRQKAEELCQQARASDSNFYRLARENTEAEDVECLIGGADTRMNLANASLALKEYEVSNVVEEGDGYYIAYCVSPSSKEINNEYKNQIVEERQILDFQNTYKSWSEEYEVKVSKSLLVE
ncbi:MAG: hypothetical protein J1F22_00520 [Lachnospiraceae bacterium]|nr:hypothetical protein [Lachnospiraceae bacterium]